MSKSVLPEITRKEINRNMLNKNIAKVLFGQPKVGKSGQRKFDRANLSHIKPERIFNQKNMQNYTDTDHKVINEGFKKRLMSTAGMFSERIDYYNPKYLKNYPEMVKGEAMTTQESPGIEPGSAHYVPKQVSRLNLEKIIQKNTQHNNFFKSKQYFKILNKNIKLTERRYAEYFIIPVLVVQSQIQGIERIFLT